VLLGLLVLLGGFAAFVATRPSDFHVERSITVQAPVDVAFAQVNDFHAWAAWSPWEKLDPAMQRSYGGAERGVGAIYEWTGKKAGAGRMEVTDVRPERIAIQLDFIKPMRASNTALFDLTPDGAGTRVTWAMVGKETLTTKLMHVVLNMDKLVGKDFEKGLADLKRQAEPGARDRLGSAA
jgi:hypothetical protein